MITIRGNYTKAELELMCEKFATIIAQLPCGHNCRPSKCEYYRLCHDLAYVNSHIIERIEE